MKIILFIILLFVSTPTWAATWYIRTDGGTATQCTGHTDAAYPGAGTGQACALNHPNWVFPPRSESTTAKAAAGDTVVLGASQTAAKFRIGCQNAATCRDATVNLTQSSFCSPSFPYDCFMSDGSSSTVGIPNNITIIGCSVTGCSSQANRPELWGAGRVSQVLNATSSTGFTLKDFIITDHAVLGNGHPTLGGGSASSSELSGRDGLLLTHSSGGTLTNIYIHGMFHNGITAGYLGATTFNGTTAIDFNALAGIDGDTCNNDGTCGVANGANITFQGNSTSSMGSISWNGCVEAYDGTSGLATAAASGCYSQNNGGYGDGLGTTTGSGNWVFKYWKFQHNTSDGLDLKYCSATGCTIDVRNSYMGGNIGNQLKTSGTTVVYNSILEADCDYFVGKSFTASGIDTCRALGDAYNVNYAPNVTVKFYGNTIINMKGNVAFSVVANGQANCTSSNTLDIKNTVVYSPGKAAVLGGGVPGFKDIDSACSSMVFTNTQDIVYGFSSNPAGTGNIFTDPLLSGLTTESETAAYLSSSSPARNVANTGASGQPSTDYNDFARGGSWDIGALEFGSQSSSAVCGNGIIEGSEGCDDGNTTSGDGCSSTCTIETPTSFSPFKGSIGNGLLKITNGKLIIN